MINIGISILHVYTCRTLILTPSYEQRTHTITFSTNEKNGRKKKRKYSTNEIFRITTKPVKLIISIQNIHSNKSAFLDEHEIPLLCNKMN